MKITKKKEFELFKKFCREYIDKFELNNWTFRFYTKNHNKKFEGAYIERLLDNCQADIHFDSSYVHNGSSDNIRESAKHEVLHCLIGKIYLLGKQRFIIEYEYEREEEELIHKLEKIIP